MIGLVEILEEKIRLLLNSQALEKMVRSLLIKIKWKLYLKWAKIQLSTKTIPRQVQERIIQEEPSKGFNN